MTASETGGSQPHPGVRSPLLSTSNPPHLSVTDLMKLLGHLIVTASLRFIDSALRPGLKSKYLSTSTGYRRLL